MPKFEHGNKFGKGRPKGSLNKRTAALRTRIEKLIDSVDLENDITELSASERLKLVASLIEFILPKQSRTDAAVEARLNELEQMLKQ